MHTCTHAHAHARTHTHTHTHTHAHTHTHIHTHTAHTHTRTHTGLSLTCYCSQLPYFQPDSCPDNTEECVSGTTHCFYRSQLQNGRRLEDYGCLEAGSELVREICEEGKNNVDDDQWRCCETDNCNEDFEEIILPAEMTMGTPTIGTTTVAGTVYTYMYMHMCTLK